MQQTKVKSEYCDKMLCCREYAYREDTNYPIRHQMEDSHFYFDNYLQDNCSGLFAILDGHGGLEVVEYATRVLPDLFKKDIKQWNPKNALQYFETIFAKVDEQLRLVGAFEIGATCCLTFIKRENNKQMCYIANLGDTRAVINQNGKAIRLTVDHKSSNEQEQLRVKNEGGMIVRNRVMGQLAVTRAFGDLELKNNGVSIRPDLKEIELTQEYKYLIMASDGLWDVCDDQKAVDLTQDKKNADEMTKELLQFALKSGSKDNISIIILTF